MFIFFARFQYITNGERYEVVIDFSQFAGKAIELRNFPSAGGITVETDYANTAHVMRFNVSSAGPAAQDTSAVPAALRTVPFPHSATPGTVNHRFGFHREDDGLWTINGHGFSDANNRVLANVPQGTVEIWELVNGRTMGSHPVHVHLVDFRVIQRTGGRGAVMPYESAGLKDVVWLGKGENALVEAHYAPWDGVYMFHCHNMSKSSLLLFSLSFFLFLFSLLSPPPPDTQVPNISHALDVGCVSKVTPS